MIKLIFTPESSGNPAVEVPGMTQMRSPQIEASSARWQAYQQTLMQYHGWVRALVEPFAKLHASCVLVCVCVGVGSDPNCFALDPAEHC